MSETKRIRFIINPISGVGRQKTVEKQLELKLDRSVWEPEIVYTEGPKHATELAREGAQAGCHAVVAVGGDGSVNEVGTGLVGTGTLMGIVPTGSGNGLARHLKLPLRVGNALHRLNSATPRTIDTVTMNGKVFLGVAGVGFDAHIAHAFDTFGIRGLQGYIQLAIRELPQYKTGKVRVTTDDAIIEVDAFSVTVANSAQFGNNAIIAPNALLDDGLLEVCIIKKFPMTVLPGLVTRMFQGTIDGSQYAIHLRGTTIRIEQEGTLAHMDGEPAEPGRSILFEVKPQSLQILV